MASRVSLEATQEEYQSAAIQGYLDRQRATGLFFVAALGMQFRLNRRGRSDLFVDTLRHMVTADPLRFENLAA